MIIYVLPELAISITQMGCQSVHRRPVKKCWRGFLLFSISFFCLAQALTTAQDGYKRAKEENIQLQQQIKESNQDYRKRMWKYVQDIAVRRILRMLTSATYKIQAMFAPRL